MNLCFQNRDQTLHSDQATTPIQDSAQLKVDKFITLTQPIYFDEYIQQAVTMFQTLTNPKLIPLDLERRLPNSVTVFEAFNRLDYIYQEIVRDHEERRVNETKKQMIDNIRERYWINKDERHIFIQNLQICRQLDVDEGFAPKYQCYPYAPGTLNCYLIRTPAVYRAGGKRVPADLEPRRTRSPSPPVQFNVHEDLGFKRTDSDESDHDDKYMASLSSHLLPTCSICRRVKGPQGEAVGKLPCHHTIYASCFDTLVKQTPGYLPYAECGLCSRHYNLTVVPPFTQLTDPEHFIKPSDFDQEYFRRNLMQRDQVLVDGASMIWDEHRTR